MVPKKYAVLGFDIAKFGANSKALRFKGKPIFVFGSNINIEIDFLTRICETYLKIYEKRKSTVGIQGI
jgi:hypothetical protein